jgi:hypothetical protein
MGFYFLGVILGKIFSVAGIGSLLAGIFVKKQKYLIMFIIFFAFLDTFLICQLNPACRFERSFIFALIGATIVGYLTYFIKKRRKSKK